MLGGYGLCWLVNESPHPCERFSVSSAEWHALLAGAELVLHSHPGGALFPSLRDQQQQLATRVPWYIKPAGADGFFFGDGSPKRQLIGRGYRFAVDDCFSVVRDALAQLRDIHVRNMPREWDTFSQGFPYFDSQFEQIGMECVAESVQEAKVGDCFIFQIHADTFNHCGYCWAPGVMLHHPSAPVPYSPTWLSRRERLERWASTPVKVLRFRHGRG